MQVKELLYHVAGRFTHVTVVVMGSSSTLKQLTAINAQAAAAGRKAGISLEMCVSHLAPYLIRVREDSRCCWVAGYCWTV